MNAISESFRLPGYYWISLEGQEAEEACWDGRHWFVSGSRTRIVGAVVALTARTAPLPSAKVEGLSAGRS